MATKSGKKGRYICKVGFYDIYAKDTMRAKKNRRPGSSEMEVGSTAYEIYHSKKLVEKGFKTKDEAVEMAKFLVTKYKKVGFIPTFIFIYMEQNKITESLEKLIYRLYSAEQIYDDVISYYDDDDDYVVIKYTLSDRTKVTYSKESKHYDASIILDIEEIVKDDEVYYYQHDIPEYIWDDLIDYEYNKIDKILSPVVSNILIDVNITFIDK